MYKRQQLSTFMFCFLCLYGTVQVLHEKAAKAICDLMTELIYTGTTQLLEEDRASIEAQFLPYQLEISIEPVMKYDLKDLMSNANQ